jgi:predicted dehydrogenase
LPEGVVAPEGADPESLYLRPFFENSCHGIDMVRFVLGELKVEAVRLLRSGQGRIGGVTAILSTDRGDLVSFLGNWSAPANYAVTLHRPGRRLELLPFEAATVYEGMDMIDPSDEWPIRRYLPRQTGRIHLDEIDRKEKPGFVAQARAFRDLVEGRAAPENAATLADARSAVALCESLTGVRYEC